MTRENGETQCISFEHETYFIHRKFNSLEFCIWQVAQVIQIHATMWLIARTRRSGTGYIFMRAFSTGLSPADQMNPWLLSIYESFWYLFFFFADRYVTNEAVRTWHFSRCNFYASEFCVWMFNSGFRTLLFTMTIDLIKLRPRRAFRAASTARKHASVYSCYASLRNWVFLELRFRWQSFALY